MDRLERLNELREAILVALQGWQAGIRTALPGIVQSFNAVEGTVIVQPAINARISKPDKTVEVVALPLLLDVPVCFPRGGGYTLTFPIAEDDECLVVLSDRCIDGWWEQGDVAIPPSVCMHDLSDGFAIVGPWSKPNVIDAISTNTVQLRSDDGECYVELENGHIVNIVAPGGINLIGNLHVTGTVQATADGTFGGKSMDNHVHTGVKSGIELTGPPF